MTILQKIEFKLAVNVLSELINFPHNVDILIGY